MKQPGWRTKHVATLALLNLRAVETGRVKEWYVASDTTINPRAVHYPVPSLASIPGSLSAGSHHLQFSSSSAFICSGKKIQKFLFHPIEQSTKALLKYLRNAGE